jgi:hypothetical protein
MWQRACSAVRTSFFETALVRKSCTAMLSLPTSTCSETRDPRGASERPILPRLWVSTVANLFIQRTSQFSHRTFCRLERTHGSRLGQRGPMIARNFCTAALFAFLLQVSSLGQAKASQEQPPTSSPAPLSPSAKVEDYPTAASQPSPRPQGITQNGGSQSQLPDARGATIIDKNEEVLKQSSRIMGVLPNFTAVDSNTLLPPLTTKEKYLIAMHDSVDYSSFVLAAALAAKGLQGNATPQLGTGFRGFTRYYWRQFTDQAVGTFFTEAIIPELTREDPRYYTLGRNGFLKRTSYAISRTFITKNDAGRNTFNISEIGGNFAEAGISNLYYPSEERGIGKTVKNFGTATAVTAAANVLKEFWPDIRKNVLRRKD